MRLCFSTVVGNSPLDKRHGRSCDLQTTNDDEKPDKYDNPIAQVRRGSVVDANRIRRLDLCEMNEEVRRNGLRERIVS